MYWNTKIKIVPHKEYLGLDLCELEDIEMFFDVMINVYQLQLDDEQVIASRLHVSNKN